MQLVENFKEIHRSWNLNQDSGNLKHAYWSKVIFSLRLIFTLTVKRNSGHSMLIIVVYTYLLFALEMCLVFTYLDFFIFLIVC